MRPEERNDHLEEIIASIDLIAVEILSVVVMPSIDGHSAHTEELLEFVEARDATGALNYHEPMRHLVAGYVAFPSSAALLPHEPDGEASFSVYEANDPVRTDRPFLLVFRTFRIVTAHSVQATASTGRILGFSSI